AGPEWGRALGADPLAPVHTLRATGVSGLNPGSTWYSPSRATALPRGIRTCLHDLGAGSGTYRRRLLRRPRRRDPQLIVGIGGLSRFLLFLTACADGGPGSEEQQEPGDEVGEHHQPDHRAEQLSGGAGGNAVQIDGESLLQDLE